MAVIRIINKPVIQTDRPLQPDRPLKPENPIPRVDPVIPAIPVEPAKGELLVNRIESVSTRENCGSNDITWEFSRDYNGPMAFGITNDSKISGRILIGKNVHYPDAETIIKNFSYEDRGTELININVKKGYKLELEFDNGKFLKHEGENKPAKCYRTDEEVVAEGVNYTTYRIGFGDEGQYGGIDNTRVYILKPKKPKEPDVAEVIPVVVAPEHPVVVPAQPAETSGGGGSSSDSYDLPSASSGATDGANPGGYGALNIDSFS